MRSWPEGEWAVAESQRGMTHTHKVKFVCQSATSWITGIFLRGKIEIFTVGLGSTYRVLQRDDAGSSGNCMRKAQRSDKWTHSWDEGLSSLLESEWVVAEFQREMTQEKVKCVCQGATPFH